MSSPYCQECKTSPIDGLIREMKPPPRSLPRKVDHIHFQSKTWAPCKLPGSLRIYLWSSKEEVKSGVSGPGLARPSEHSSLFLKKRGFRFFLLTDHRQIYSCLSGVISKYKHCTYLGDPLFGTLTQQRVRRTFMYLLYLLPHPVADISCLRAAYIELHENTNI